MEVMTAVAAMAAKYRVPLRFAKLIFEMNDFQLEQLDEKIIFVANIVANYPMKAVFTDHEAECIAIRYKVQKHIAAMTLMSEQIHNSKMRRADRILFLAKVFNHMDRIITHYLP